MYQEECMDINSNNNKWYIESWPNLNRNFHEESNIKNPLSGI